ncbi:hypothetical protein [Sinorhizobium medicae]|uniref:hypothetical protein n=2 Tax=Sinorhizobium medicae TaxID=110321 RepID=UPI0012684287|nr:hypothetical protein [Sinorhizobium medicae]MBO1944806.1 hypothetical protein [Sinorhizobium medicae]MDX0499443.1 hypothetical protein [Sinorhizobium medicae]MDX0931023.1 hypothetical protein [Sinorhizobium medicae]WQO60912.1 hypothetical protein U8C35_23550 [Sinorhizobium medicae]
MPTVTEEMKMRVGYSRTDEHGFLERGDQVAIADAYESRDLGTLQGPTKVQAENDRILLAAKRRLAYPHRHG